MRWGNIMALSFDADNSLENGPWSTMSSLSFPYNVFRTPTKIIQHSSDCVSLSTSLLLQTQAYHNVSVPSPAEKSMPGMAVLLGAVGIGMCGYSSKQLALYHRPSARVLQWVGTHTDASMVGTAAHRAPILDVTRRGNACQEFPPPSFVGEKVPAK